MADSLLEKVLTEERYVRRLAGALLLQDSDVDDLIQDVHVLALERPQSVENPRGWLRKVVQNLAFDAHRKNARRRRRHQAVSRPEAVPSVAEIQAQESVRRQVVEKLLGLPPLYREPLVLRFFRGMESVEIAEQLGINQSTVRTRLQRGLEMIRGEMDAQHRGRAAWAVVLAPYAGLSARDVLPASGKLAVWALGGVGVAALLIGGVWLLGQASPAVIPSVREANASSAQPAAADERRIEPVAPAAAEVDRLLLHGGLPAVGFAYGVHTGATLPSQPGKLRFWDDPRRFLNRRTDEKGRIEISGRGVLWCEVTPHVLVAFVVDREKGVHSLRLPELGDLTFKWPEGQAPQRWRVAAHPYWPAWPPDAVPMVRNARFWGSEDPRFYGNVDRVVVLPRPHVEGWGAALLLEQTHLVEGATEFRLRTLADAKYKVWAAAPGQVVQPVWGDHVYLRVPSDVMCRRKGSGATGRIRLVDAAGKPWRVSGRFRLYDLKKRSYETSLPIDPLGSQIGRSFRGGEIDLGNTGIGAHGSVGPYWLELITDDGELFLQKFELVAGGDTPVVIRKGSGRRPQRVLANHATLRFGPNDIIYLAERDGRPRRVRLSSRRKSVSFVGCSEDGTTLFLHRDLPWDEAWILKDSGHIGRVLDRRGGGAVVCHWLPTRKVDPIDLRAAARRHGLDRLAVFRLQFRLPRWVKKDGWVDYGVRQLDGTWSSLAAPEWGFVVPVGVETRLGVSSDHSKEPTIERVF